VQSGNAPADLSAGALPSFVHVDPSIRSKHQNHHFNEFSEHRIGIIFTEASITCLRNPPIERLLRLVVDTFSLFFCTEYFFNHQATVDKSLPLFPKVLRQKIKLRI